MNPEQLQQLMRYMQQMYPQYVGNNMLDNAYSNATLSQQGDVTNPYPNISNNIAVSNGTTPTTLSPAISSQIPQEVLNEPTSDWENEGLVFQGQRYRVENGQWVLDSSPMTTVAPWAGNNSQSEPQSFDWNNYAPFLNPYGTDLQTDFYNLGRFTGMEKGTSGRGLGIASAGVSALLGGARTALSGYANSVATARVQQEARERMQRRNYTPQTQYRNNNYIGGDIK